MKLQRAIYETLANGFILLLQFLIRLAIPCLSDSSLANRFILLLQFLMVAAVSTAVVVLGAYLIYVVTN